MRFVAEDVFWSVRNRVSGDVHVCLAGQDEYDIVIACHNSALFGMRVNLFIRVFFDNVFEEFE